MQVTTDAWQVTRGEQRTSLSQGIHVIYGHPAARDVGFYMTAEWLCQGQVAGHTGTRRAVVVDGENSFDPFVFCNAARRVAVAPEALLRNLFVSRAFTCHQLQALIVDRLIPALQQTRSQMILVLGLLATFCDEQVPLWEAQRLLRPTLGRLHGLARRGYSVLLLLPGGPHPTTKRLSFLQLTKTCADQVVRVEAETNPKTQDYIVTLRSEKPQSEKVDWQISFDPAMQPRKRWQSVG